MTESFADVGDAKRIEAVPIEKRITVRNVYDLLRESTARDPDAPAVIWLPNGLARDDARTISYREFLAGVTGTANLLHELGVRDGRAVSILLPNLPETYFAIWGGSAAGVANPINPLLAPSQIADIMMAADSRVLVVGGPDVAYDVFDKAAAVRDLYPALSQVVVVGDGYDRVRGGIDFASRLAEMPSDRLLSGRVILPDDPSVYFHTGGTTGSPKLAQQTHWNQVAMASLAAIVTGLGRSDRILTGLPLFHANAAITTGLSGLAAGAANILCGQQGYRSKAMLADFWNIVAKYRASMFSGVPTIYSALLEQLADDLDVSSLRFGLCGAAPMPVSLMRSFEERTGVRILEGYGMTEGGAISTINPKDGERRVGSIGIRLPYQDILPAILDDDGEFVRECGVDEVGVLLLKGPNVFPGYRQEQFNRNCWPIDGYFNSGDLGRRDPDGYYHLAGRAKDLIIRSGHNIDPAIIEEALHQHPDVELAAAVGKPDPYAGELPVAYVSVVSGSQVTENQLLEFAREEVPERPAAPVEVFILPVMPITAVGKIFKPTLRLDVTRRALAEALAVVAPSATVTTRHDERRGIVADVACIDPAETARAVDVLNRFTIPFDLVNCKSIST